MAEGIAAECGYALRVGANTHSDLMNIEALCAAPPEALAHSPSQMPLSCPVAPGRPKLMPGCGPAGRRALAHADTPNTSPGCRSCASAPSPTGARPRRRAADLAALPKRISARRRAADHAALRALAHVQRAYEGRSRGSQSVRPRPPARALTRRRAPSPAGARTSPGCRPRRASEENFARRRAADLAALRALAHATKTFSTVLLGTSHILRSILRRILRHVLHVQRGRRRACVGPEVSRRWKTTRHDEDRHASFAAPKTPSAKSCTKSFATSFTCSSFTCRPRQWPKRAEDVFKPSVGLPHQQRVQRALRDDE